MKVILDAGRIEEKGKSHEYLKEMLQLPEHYGKNLDALHDCLTEMDKTEILWDNIEQAGTPRLRYADPGRLDIPGTSQNNNSIPVSS